MFCVPYRIMRSRFTAAAEIREEGLMVYCRPLLCPLPRVWCTSRSHWRACEGLHGVSCTASTLAFLRVGQRAPSVRLPGGSWYEIPTVYVTVSYLASCPIAYSQLQVIVPGKRHRASFWRPSLSTPPASVCIWHSHSSCSSTEVAVAVAIVVAVVVLIVVVVVVAVVLLPRVC